MEKPLRFTKKPVEVEAMLLEFTTSSQEAIIEWSEGLVKKGLDGGLIVPTQWRYES